MRAGGKYAYPFIEYARAYSPSEAVKVIALRLSKKEGEDVFLQDKEVEEVSPPRSQSATILAEIEAEKANTIPSPLKAEHPKLF